MKKIMALLLAFALVFSLAACDTSGDGGDETDNKDGFKDITIGVIYNSIDDDLGQHVYSYLTHAGEVLGSVKFEWVTGVSSVEDQTAAAENLISKGVDGIILFSTYELATQNVTKRCEDAGIYVFQIFRTLAEPDIIQYCTNSDAYLGSAIEAGGDASYQMVKVLADLGDKEIGAGTCRTASSFTDRMSAFDNAISDFHLNLLGEYDIGLNFATIEVDVQNLLDLYPSMEALWTASAAAGIGEKTVNVLRAHYEATGKKVHYITYDTFSGMKEAFDEGILVGAVGGQAPIALLALSVLVNKIDGHPLSDDTLFLTFPYMLVLNPEDLATYEDYYADTTFQPYSDNSIKSFFYRSGGSANLEEYQGVWDQYGADWIRDRVAGKN